MSARIRRQRQKAALAYISIGLIVFEQVYRKLQSAETQSKQRLIYPRLLRSALLEEHPRLSILDLKESPHW